MNAYLLHQPAPLVVRSATAHRDAIAPQHTRTATVFARLLERLPPVLAEKYVLPWAGGTPRIDRLCAAVTSATAPPARKLAIPQARSHNLAALCREAMHQAWRDGAGAGGSMFEDAAQRAVAGLTGENATDCLAVLASARPVDTYLAAQLLAAVARQADPDPARDRLRQPELCNRVRFEVVDGSDERRNVRVRITNLRSHYEVATCLRTPQLFGRSTTRFPVQRTSAFSAGPVFASIS